MSYEIITQCPNCSTSFKVKEVQLNAAAGAVRCGACLVVFQAIEHMLQDLIDEELVNDSSRDALDSHSEAMFADSESPALVQHEASSGASLEEPLEEPLQSTESSNDNSRFDIRTIEPLSDSSVDETVASEADLSIEFQTSNAQQNFQNTDAMLATKVSGPVVDNDDRLEEASTAAHKDTASDTGLPFLHGQQGQTEDESPEAGEEADSLASAGTIAISGETSDDANPAEGTMPQDIVTDELKNERLQEDILLDDVFLADEPTVININVDPEPVELDHSAASVLETKQILWAVCSLFLIMSLLLQFGWFNRNELSQRLELRDVYLQLCERVPCQLADFVDGSALAISDLVVRTHPTVDRSLIVDAILRNSAPYKQKFPNLALQFSDISGRTIAAREFVPREYLGGELIGRSYIPAATEVRLSLEIVDPGDRAVGHALSVRVN